MINEDESNLPSTGCPGSFGIGTSSHPITGSDAMIKEYCKQEILLLQKPSRAQQTSQSDSTTSRIAMMLDEESQLNCTQQQMPSYLHCSLQMQMLQQHEQLSHLQPLMSTADTSACNNNNNNNNASGNQGRWTKEEHLKFVEGISLHGKNWKKVEEHVNSRTGAQIRSHAQKFFNKLERDYNKKHGITSITPSHSFLQKDTCINEEDDQTPSKTPSNNIACTTSSTATPTQTKMIPPTHPTKLFIEKSKQSSTTTTTIVPSINQQNQSKQQPQLQNKPANHMMNNLPSSSSSSLDLPAIFQGLSLRTRSDPLCKTSQQQPHTDDSQDQEVYHQQQNLLQEQTSLVQQQLQHVLRFLSVFSNIQEQQQQLQQVQQQQQQQQQQQHSKQMNSKTLNNQRERKEDVFSQENKENINPRTLSVNNTDSPSNHESFFDFVVNKYGGIFNAQSDENRNVLPLRPSLSALTTQSTKQLNSLLPTNSSSCQLNRSVSDSINNKSSSSSSSNILIKHERQMPLPLPTKLSLGKARKSSFTLCNSSLSTSSMKNNNEFKNTSSSEKTNVANNIDDLVRKRFCSNPTTDISHTPVMRNPTIIEDINSMNLFKTN